LTVSWLSDQTFALHNDPSQIWWFTFVKNAFNVDLKVTPRAPGGEVKNLMFASGDLPDIFWGANVAPNNITTDDIVVYGVSEKLIMPISQYINAALMPNLYKLFQEQPGLKGSSVASDGNIYGFPQFRSKDWMHGPVTGGYRRSFFNQKWLDQLGLKIPQTLDEYMNVLRKFKTLGADILPDGGVFSAQNNFSMIWSALGFHWTNDNLLVNVGVRNGTATFLYGDKNIYPKFVELIKAEYDEGLISKDFFTWNANARNAISMQGKVGVLPQPADVITDQPYKFDYVSNKPLTSEFNSEVFWMGPDYGTPNQVIITSKCKYPEVVCRIFDFAYDPINAVYANSGYPDNDPAMNYGMQKGWYIDRNTIQHYWDPPNAYENVNSFAMSRIRPTNSVPGYLANLDLDGMKIYGLNPPAESFDVTLANDFVRKSVWENLAPYLTTQFPLTVYWDQDKSRRISDLSSVLNDYATTQFAQFVTGARPLSDMNNYFAELDRMNYQEYLKYFVDYYDTIKAAK